LDALTDAVGRSKLARRLAATYHYHPKHVSRFRGNVPPSDWCGRKSWNTCKAVNTMFVVPSGMVETLREARERERG
jgi:hypothetical protein